MYDMELELIRKIAKDLYEAEMSHSKIEKLTVAYPGITVDDAYRIQLEANQLKEAAGDVIVGKKIGLTSNAMRKRAGIKEPDYGTLFAGNMHSTEVPLSMKDLVQPLVESEIAFVLKKDLRGPAVTPAEVLAATEGIMCAFEIVDCRYTDFKVGLPDTIADNASCGKIILGTKLVPVDNLDMRTIGLVLERNGEVIDLSASASVMGNPAEAVAWLANKISAFGMYLKAGEIVMSGSFTDTHPVEPGDNFAAYFGNGVGNVKIKFTE